MNTRPPKRRLRRPKPTDKITITRRDAECIVATRRILERADFFLHLLDDAMSEGGRWGRVHAMAVVDAGLGHLRVAISTIDPIALTLEKAFRR